MTPTQQGFVGAEFLEKIKTTMAPDHKIIVNYIGNRVNLEITLYYPFLCHNLP